MPVSVQGLDLSWRCGWRGSSGPLRSRGSICRHTILERAEIELAARVKKEVKPHAA